MDYTYQYEVAREAARNGVDSYVLISTINANPDSSFFYLKMKGQLEEAVKVLPFSSISILRPGPLTGARERIRLSEIFSTTLLEIITKFVKLDIEPVDSQRVAEVAIMAGLKQARGVKIYLPKEIIESRPGRFLKKC